MSFNSRIPNSLGCGFFRITGGLLVAFWFVAASNSVIASCGDYLGEHSHLAGRSHSAGDEIRAAVLRTKTVPTVPRCSGPGCSQAPTSPLEAPQPDFQRVTFKELSALLSSVVGTNGGWTYLEQRSDVSRKTPDRDRLNRPPQHLS